MYTVEIAVDALNRRLPAICLITGEGSGVDWRKVDLGWHPPWANLLLLLGLLPGLIVTTLLTRRASGELPFQPRAWWRWKLGQLLFGVSLVGGLAGLITVIVIGLTLSGGVILAVSFGTPIAVWKVMLAGRGIRVLEITETHVTLSIPSERAAQALGGKLTGSSLKLSAATARALEQAALATTDAPERSTCAVHTQTIAPWCCGRCGSFFCPVCAEYPSKGSKPVCAKCFGAR